MVLLGLGHASALQSAARAPVFGQCSWALLPVMLRSSSTHYVEYFLLGRGGRCPNLWRMSSWIGPLPIAVEAVARLVA